MVENWKKLSTEPLAEYRIFNIRQDTRLSPRTGNTHGFYVLEAPDWINIIPITPEGEVVFIHQFRHGTEQVTLEVPGGMVDDSDNSLGDGARREMLEETGYDAEKIIHIGTVEPNPAFQNNHCHTFLALNAHWVQTPEFDGAEDIAVEKIPLTAVPHLITSGKITHSLVVCAFYHFDQLQKQQPDLLNFSA